ncbi:MAG: hypothetical protein QXM68_03310 [Candidatus Aenigmatarchaeota archaeon]|nr:hypothetical protein [Candidatus Aenigmarchaeota archaeon]
MERLKPFVYSSLAIAADGVTTLFGIYKGVEEAWPLTKLGLYLYGDTYLLYRTIFGICLTATIGAALLFYDMKKQRYSHRLFLYSVGLIEALAALNNALCLIK